MRKMAKSKAAAATLNNAEKTVPKQLAPYAFQPGNNLGKGRPKGSRNKLGEDFLSALQADFAENGVDTIAKVRQERPHEYLKVVASILPKELHVKTDAFEEMTDDELAAGIAALQRALAAQEAGARSPTKARH
jgi:hypothetical protein